MTVAGPCVFGFDATRIEASEFLGRVADRVRPAARWRRDDRVDSFLRHPFGRVC
jgi:hypothetical protein